MGARFGGMLGLLRSPAVLAVTDKNHGLGNRVRSVLGSLLLARSESRAFAYAWPVGKEFGAKLDELWEFDAPVVSTVTSRAATLVFPYRDNKLQWLDEEARTRRLWQIRTPHALMLPPGCPPWEEELRALTPSEQVRQGILEAFRDGPDGEPYVGVMIRTHAKAHPQTLRQSPLTWYLRRMQAITDWWPEVQFYVSTDTPGAFHEVRRHFAHCHGTAEKGPYNSQRALMASVVDVYMLASGCHLLAPHFSSFPELSQRLAGPQLRLETSMNTRKSALVTGMALSMAPNPLKPFDRNRLG